MTAKFGRVLLALPAVVYLLLPTRNFYWDGVAFAINIEKLLPPRENLHPNHLLYTVAGEWLYRAALACGLHVRALFLLQAANSLLAAGAVVLLYRALRRRDFPTESAVAAALTFAFAATWWRFATDANAYIPSIFLILCANHLLETRRTPWLAPVAHVAAMLFHQLAILFLPVALLKTRDPRKQLSYTAATMGPVAVAYVLAYRTVFGRWDTRGFLAWIAARSPDAHFSFQPLHDLAETLAGTIRLFFGGKLDAITLSFPVIAGLIALTLSLTLVVTQFRRSPARAVVPAGKDVLCWLAVYAAFLFFWMPQNTFYRLFYLPPLVLLLWGSQRKPLPAALWCILFFANAVFLIYPQSRQNNNVPLRFALAQRDRWPSGTPIAFHIFHPDLWTISYFNPQASWIGMDHLDIAELDRSLAYARDQHQPLWLEATAYEMITADPEGRRWLSQHEVSFGLLVYRDPKHEYRFYQAR